VISDGSIANSSTDIHLGRDFGLNQTTLSIAPWASTLPKLGGRGSLGHAPFLLLVGRPCDDVLAQAIKDGNDAMRHESGPSSDCGPCCPQRASGLSFKINRLKISFCLFHHFMIIFI
jgi:hypothetical protein